MNLGVLYSGGKDSTLALMKAMEQHRIACLITIVSDNPESFMFHTPNIDITLLQSEAMGIPLVRRKTKGMKEAELEDLKEAIVEAKGQYGIEGIVTGAVLSGYQRTRIEGICSALGLKCLNPLWHIDQIRLLNELVEKGIISIISGVFAEPLDESYLGMVIDREVIERLAMAAQTHKLNPAGEGGEIETTVIDAPVFKKRIVITKTSTKYKNHSGTFIIEDARLEQK
jgi:ABC transporter with metal-binding/Fe-S-binding domain ATP-binding protein